MKPLVVVCVLVALLAPACSSKKKAAAKPETTPVAVLPPAKSADEWATRVVDVLLRPLNQDLAVVSHFDSPQIRIYIQTGNETTLRTIRTRMNDLSRCSAKLVTIGRPPPGSAALAAVNRHLRAACTPYVSVAQKLLSAAQMLSSGRTDVAKRGNDVAASAREPSRRAALELTAAIRLAQRQPAFLRAGLKPSV